MIHTFIPAIASVLMLACCAAGGGERPAASSEKRAELGKAPALGSMVPVMDEAAERPPFGFSALDAQLLDEVQHGAFLYLWECVEKPTGMVRDRSSKPVVSVAGVGFQLAGIPVGVERGWITREQGQERTLTILRALESNKKNRKDGVFFHYLDGGDGGPCHTGYETVASTIDGALLLAGMVVGGEYFGGEAREISERLFAEVNWNAYVAKGDRFKPSERGFICLAWRPKDFKNDPTGAGELSPYVWMDGGDEQRLVTFLAACAPDEAKRVDPALYYRLRRRLGNDAGGPPFVWFPWSGALFTSFFAHCFIEYGAMGPDNPGALGVVRRPAVDWWVNGLRTVRMHQRKSLDDHGTGYRPWGMTACDGPGGYNVPGLFPMAGPTDGLLEDFDYHPDVVPADNLIDGTVGVYGAGCSIMFDPAGAVEALRAFRVLKADDGSALVWRDPNPGCSFDDARYGFLDSFNLSWKGKDQAQAGPWVASDCVAIDQGPLLLAIENARTGLVWRLFHQSKLVQAGMERLGLRLAVKGDKR
jgi:hypothetical protein